VNSPFSDLVEQLAAKGLNHIGALSVEAYDELVRPEQRSALVAPYAETVLVVASGGKSLWRSMLADFRAHPQHLSGEPHPLDAFIRRSVAQAGTAIGECQHRWIFADEESELHLDFRTLAVGAGLGAPSRLGLAIDSRWGPWMGLRAVCFLASRVVPTPLVDSPCDGCDAPCVQACVGDAFVDRQWDVQRCADVHVETTLCADSCAARMACPVGADEQYTALQRRYHYNRVSGRILLAAHLGETRDLHEGSGPVWGGWGDG